MLILPDLGQSMLYFQGGGSREAGIFSQIEWSPCAEQQVNGQHTGAQSQFGRCKDAALRHRVLERPLPTVRQLATEVQNCSDEGISGSGSSEATRLEYAVPRVVSVYGRLFGMVTT